MGPGLIMLPRKAVRLQQLILHGRTAGRYAFLFPGLGVVVYSVQAPVLLGVTFAAEGLIDGGDGFVPEAGQMFLGSAMAGITGQRRVSGAFLERLYLSVAWIAGQTIVPGVLCFRLRRLVRGKNEDQGRQTDKHRDDKSDQ